MKIAGASAFHRQSLLAWLVCESWPRSCLLPSAKASLLTGGLFFGEGCSGAQHYVFLDIILFCQILNFPGCFFSLLPSFQRPLSPKGWLFLRLFPQAPCAFLGHFPTVMLHSTRILFQYFCHSMDFVFPVVSPLCGFS